MFSCAQGDYVNIGNIVQNNIVWNKNYKILLYKLKCFGIFFSDIIWIFSSFSSYFADATVKVRIKIRLKAAVWGKQYDWKITREYNKNITIARYIWFNRKVVANILFTPAEHILNQSLIDNVWNKLIENKLKHWGLQSNLNVNRTSNNR